MAPFAALGIPDDRIFFGLPLKDACDRVGISLEDYLGAYDASLARPFPGVPEMLGRLEQWAVCSNKLGAYAQEEIAQLGWRPDVALFTEAFGGPKRLAPVLEALDVAAAGVVFVGDSEHDRVCAREAGVTFALAGWNPRAEAVEGDIVLGDPGDVLPLLTR